MAGAEMDRVLGCKCASLRIATNGWIHSESIRLRNDKIRKRQTMINNRHLCRCSCGTGRAPPGETSEELEHYHNHIHHYHNHHHHDTHKYYSMLLKPSKSSLQIVIILALVIAMGGSLNGAAASHQELIESISPFQHQQQPQQQQQPQNADQEQPVYSYSLPPVSEQDGSKLNADDMNNRDEDEPPGQAELDFKMMNVAHERLQAVRTLLNATRQQIISASAPEPASSLGNSDNQHNHQQLPHGRAPSAATGSSLHCTHKGRQYANGQSVPIQDQPCLNCTCRMAILQCYLRVCPPIVSLEAHKRRLQASGRVLPDERQCRMVKEAHQCCPVMKCDDDDNQLIASNLTSSTAGPEARNVVAQQSSLVGSATTMQQQQSSSTTPFDQTLNKQHQLAQRNTHGDHPHHHQLVAGSGPNHFDQAPLVAQPPRRAADNNDQLQQSASSMVHTTTTIMPFDNLPKLTVINGPAGQRDSILLITSNPQSIGLNAAQYQHQHQNHFESARFQNKSSNATNALAPFNAASTGDQEQRQLVSSAPIIEALLETIYSSAAKQLSGLNLQGSCMINGSLYFEGSAVLPESGSAQCQYCYCIRQKVMCVKPRCHLMISGCTPKYNNEFACCPTSYSCQSSIGGPTGGRGELPNGGSALARLTSFSPSAAGPSSPLSSSEGLQARLSAVLEAALARVTRNSSAANFLLQQQQAPPKMLLTTSANNELPDLNEPLTPRQIDGGQSSSSASSASLSNKLDGQDNSLEMMLNSMLEDKSTDIDSNQAATTQTTAAPTSMPTSTTTTTTSTTTTAKPTTSSTTTTSTTTTPAPTTTTTTTTTSTTAEPTTAKDSPTTIIKQPAEEEQPGEDDDDEEVDKAQPPPSLTTTSSSTTTTAKLNLEANQPRKPTLIEKKLTSVSNFLEPMNKLGPHMNTPTIPSGCMENGRSYTIGEQIPTLEPCKHCYCGPEGLKECRIVDCQVEGGHDCKPVTQEGHCCPIRYECPPRLHRPAAAANQGGSLDAPSALAAFNQCKSANGMDNCRNDSGAPMPKSNRLVDQVDEPFNGILEPLGPTDQMQQQQEQPQNGSMNSLREELEHFIMRIRPNQTGAVPTASGAQFEGADQYQMLGPPNGGGINNDTTRQDYDSVRPADVSQASVGGSGGGGDGVTGTTIASDPITIPTGMLGIPSIEPETIENLTHNLNNNLVLTTLDPFENTLPAGQPQTGTRIYSTSNNNNQSVDNYTLNNPTTESSTPPARAGLHNHNVHSTNAHSLNNHTGTSDDYLLTTLVDNMGSTQPQAPQLSSSTAPSQPELGYSNIPTNTPLDEPIELNDERPERFANPVVMTPNVTSDPSPHGVRSLRDENAAARLRNQAGGSNSSSVYFDDEAILSLINNQHTNPSQPVVAGRSFGGSEAPANEHALGGWNTNTNNNNTNYQPIYPTIVGTSDAGEGVTPSPQQDKPTTGTPIGLEAERSLSPDTTSWLRLLPQWTKTFGQRLSGIDSFQSAANGQQPDVVTLVSQNETPQPTGSVSNQQQQQTAESTARSGRQNPFMSMLKSIIASTNQQKQQLHEQAFQPVEMMSSQHRAANLIMRPLDNELASSSAAPNQTVQFHQPAETFSSAGIQSQQQPQRTKPLSSPYEPATSSSELEIVTAPVPLEPEVFGQTRAPSVDTKDLVVVASSSFARRSDVDEAEDKGQKDDAETDDDGKTPIVSGSRAPGPAAAEGRRDQNDDLTVRYFSSLSSAGLNNNNNEHATSHRSSTPPLPQSVDDTTRMIAQPTLSGRVSTSAGSSLMHTAANTNQALKQLALSCFDPATNRTYQVNERIPKLDEPCKACHCILGKEICQPLVCPERPNESCREERRPGECCSDFLCGDGLKPVSNLGAGPSTGPIVQQGANSRVLIEPANGVEQSQHNPKSLIPTQRALVMDNQGPTNNNNNNNNNIAARLTRLFGAPEGQAPIMRTTSDSNNMLPPHILRFRSRGNENQQHVHQQPQQQPQQQPPQQQPQQPRGGNQLMFAQDQLNQIKHQMSNGNNNQNNIQVPQVNQRMGVPAPSIQQQQQQQNVRPSFFPGTSLVRPPILMHPQRFIQQQQQQQQQNFLRRNDEAGGATQMVGSNPIPFSASVSNYQFQNNRLDQTAINQINSMRFHLPNNPNPMLRPSQQVVSSTRPPAPIATSNGIPPSGFMNQQGLITTNHQNTPTNNNNNNNMVNWGQSSQQTPSAGGAQMAGPQLPPALRTVPLFTTSQPNPNIVPQHTQPLVNSQNRMGIMPVMTSSAEQSPRVSSAVPGAPTGSDSMQSADKVTFKQSQMVSFSDLTTGFRPILGGLPTMLPPTTFQLPSSQSNRRAQETTTTTQLPTQTTTSSTEPSTVQTSTIRFSQELPVLNRVDSVRFPDLEEPNIIRSSASASTLAPQENISEHITEFGASTGSTTHTNPTTQDDTSTTSTDITTTTPSTTTTRADQNRDSSTWAMPSEAATTTSPSSSSSDSSSVSSSTTTTIASTSTQTAPSNESGLNESSSTTTTSSSPSSPPPSSSLDQTTENSASDPMDFFKVSECNIYGRVYKVGQPIDELSDQCKRCTCTSMGVDCQSKC